MEAEWGLLPYGIRMNMLHRLPPSMVMSLYEDAEKQPPFNIVQKTLLEKLTLEPVTSKTESVRFKEYTISMYHRYLNTVRNGILMDTEVIVIKYFVGISCFYEIVLSTKTKQEFNLNFDVAPNIEVEHEEMRIHTSSSV